MDLPAPSRLRSHPWLGLSVLLALATITLYLPVRDFGFLRYDDNRYVFENVVVRRGLSWEGIRWAFTTFHASNWHPLTWLSHQLDVTIFGTNAGPHHLVNAAIHTANALILGLALWRMTGAPSRSFVVAVLFALHPLHVESVAWVAERKDVLSTFFGFLALWAYARHSEAPSLGRLLQVTLLMALSLLAKPMWVTAPCLLLLLDVWPLRRVRGLPSAQHPVASWRALLLEKAPFFTLAVASSVLTVIAQHKGGAIAGLELGIPSRLGNAVVAYVRYLGKTAWPTGLAVPYPYATLGLPIWQPIFALVFLLGVSLFAWRQRKTRPWLLIGWWWFLGTLVPVIGLVQVGEQAMADRYTYLPLVGIFIIVAWASGELAQKLEHRRVWVGAIALPLLVLLALRTNDQISKWANEETLFRHALSVTGENGIAHTSLADYLYRQNRKSEAIVHAKAAVTTAPYFDRAWYNFAVLLRDQGELEEAAQALMKAVEINATYAKAWSNLGLVRLELGQPREAEDALRRALALDPEDATGWYNLGVFLGRTGRAADAIEAYRQTLERDPDQADALNNLAVASMSLGKIEEAIDALRSSTRVQPKSALAWFNLGALLAKRGQLSEAVAALETATKLEPADARMLSTLGSVLEAMGRRQEAQVIAERMARLRGAP